MDLTRIVVGKRDTVKSGDNYTSTNMELEFTLQPGECPYESVPEYKKKALSALDIPVESVSVSERLAGTASQKQLTLIRKLMQERGKSENEINDKVKAVKTKEEASSIITALLSERTQ